MAGLFVPTLAVAQGGLPSVQQPQPTLAHELTLVAIGAALGAILGPLGQAVASLVGPERRHRKEDVAVQRDIATGLRDLSAAMRTPARPEPESTADSLPTTALRPPGSPV